MQAELFQNCTTVGVLSNYFKNYLLSKKKIFINGLKYKCMTISKTFNVTFDEKNGISMSSCLLFRELQITNQPHRRISMPSEKAQYTNMVLQLSILIFFRQHNICFYEVD